MNKIAFETIAFLLAVSGTAAAFGGQGKDSQQTSGNPNAQAAAPRAQARASDEVLRERRTGVEFFRERTWRGVRFKLALRGALNMRAYLLNLKMCAIAFYTSQPGVELVEQPSQDHVRALTEVEHPKVIVIHMVRDVEQRDLRSYFRELLHDNMPNTRKNREGAARLLAAIPGVMAGDELQFLWFPSGRLELIVNAESLAHLENRELARAVWAIWSAPRAPAS